MNYCKRADGKGRECPHLPRKERSNAPSKDADKNRTGLGAHISGLQWLADGIVSLEGNGQNGENTGMCHSQLHERHSLACRPKKLQYYRHKVINRLEPTHLVAQHPRLGTCVHLDEDGGCADEQHQQVGNAQVG